MNASSKPPAQTISSWLANTTKEFTQAGIKTARLDAEVLLSHCFGVPRTWLHAHADDTIKHAALAHADELRIRRQVREPIAYLIGHKEFYSHDFIVTPSVLVPRPESETMIDLLMTLPAQKKATLVDVGTGSGCLGISAKLALPQLNVTLTDISPDALNIASQNATALGANVNILESDLLSNSYLQSFHFILANLPYVVQEWDTPPELDHEPELALYAEDSGLRLINKLLDQAPSHLEIDGYVLLEADPEQHEAIVTRGQQNGLVLETVRDYIVVLKKS